jgi:AAA domain
MTRYDPSLFVRRMAIYRGASAVYDERFHDGLNIVRGENSSGKSTLLNFLFYGLGGDLSDWSEYALLCDNVYVEVELSGKTVTFRRAVGKKNGQPMEIIPFGMDEIGDRVMEWTRYPYARSDSRESFSQALFHLLEMPQISDQISANVTMHQILRLLYSDQLSPVESLFRHEQFDPPSLREAVGNLLCGAFDQKYYGNQIALKSKDDEYKSISGKLQNLFELLGQIENDTFPLQIDSEIQKANSRITEIGLAIKIAEASLFSAGDSTSKSIDEQQATYQSLVLVQEKLAEARDRVSKLRLDIEDSGNFIRDLERRLRALDESAFMTEQLGRIEFRWCPSCYAPLDEQSSHTCHLCKSPFDDDAGRTRLANLVSSTSLQLRQSNSLQSIRQRELTRASEEFSNLEQEWKSLAAKYDSVKSAPSSEATSMIKSLQRELGYLERQLEDLKRKREQAKLLTELSEKKADLLAEISLLRDANEGLGRQQEERRRAALTSISEKVKYMLRNDLRRQDAFENPESVWFDFRLNKIGVDQQSYFSASSRTYLRNSFFIGMLMAACELPYMRHPRFCMLDTVEDKGMEMERSHNFQLLVRRMSQETNTAHQIILGTAMIVPELDTEEFTVGRRSTRDQPSLALG